MLRGNIANLDAGGKTSFRLWIDRNADRPQSLRFDYKPHSLLRVSSVADPAILERRRSAACPA